MTHRNPKLRESTRGRVFEIVAILFTAAGKFVLGDLLGQNLFYVVFACAFWIAYVMLRHRGDATVLARWGFNRHGISSGVRMVAPAFVLIVGFIVFGLATGRSVVTWNTAILMAVYPVWGTIQQFMLVALFADNLSALSRERVSERGAILLAAIVFALIHLPVLPLVGATFVLGLITTTVFFRTRSLWVPGVFHGWYATIFYAFVLGEDPLGTFISRAIGL